MSQKKYLLVEWVEEGNVFPIYDVVSTNSVVGDETDFHPGKIIFVRTNGNSAKQAQILRISEDKKLIKEHKIILERQDYQVKNMLSMCMRTIKEIKTEPLLFANKSPINNPRGSNTTLIQSKQDDSDSSDSEDDKIAKNMSLISPANSQHKYIESNSLNGSNNASGSKPTRRPVATDTPLPTHCLKEESKLSFDQATQTDYIENVPSEKLEQLEIVLNHLYRQFLTLVSRLQLDCFEPGGDQNGTVEENGDSTVAVAGQFEAVNQERQNINNEVEELQRNAKLEVRRVSAQTTNTVETQQPSVSTIAERNMMVPLGLGHALIPARLLNEINWSSYTAATRKLLQAVFPRKVLATHSLSGKPSPIYSNKPVKKSLDQKLTDDIVSTVTEHCGVPRGIVRKCISVMCADEAKLYRNRMQGRKNQSTKQDDENVSPSPPV